MSALPTREEAQQILDSPDTYIWVALTEPRKIIHAYADGRLIDRDDINVEAALECAHDYQPSMPDREVHAIVNAALGIGADDE